MTYDLVLAGGRLVDGSGAPARPGELAIAAGRIAAVGAPGALAPGPVTAAASSASSSSRVIDVGGRVIAPGFIDIHSHADFLLPLPDQAAFLRPFAAQGITTLVTGNCGYAPAPVDAGSADLLQAYTAFIKPRDLAWRWRSFGEFLDRVEEHGVLLNAVPLAAHGALRIAVMGFADRAARSAELNAMQDLLRECLESGAFGLSAGLIYAPGMFADTRELIELARLLRPAGGIFTAHVRGSSETLIPAAAEVIEIGRAAGVRVQHSHLEAFGRRHWPAVDTVLAMHEAARRDVDHGFDVIPYTAANTTFLAILPPWSLAGGVPQLLARLRDPATRARIRRDIDTVVPSWPTWEPGGWPHNLVRATGWENIWILWTGAERCRAAEGKSVAQLAAESGRESFEVAAELILETRGQVTALYVGVSGDLEEEAPLRRVLAHPHAAIETDAFSLGRGRPHPALAGGFPRVLGRYVREEKLLTLEEAVRRMTALSAARLGIADRGRLEPGCWADVTVFDPDTVGDRGTFMDSERSPAGIEWVLVNGEPVVERGGVVAGRLPGRVLRRGGL